MENKTVQEETINQIEEFDSDFLNEVVMKAINMNCEEIIEEHKSLIGKKYKDEDYIGDYGRSFMSRLLNFDYGYCIPKETPKGLGEFFNSKHFSDNFKIMLKEIIEKHHSCVPELLNSDKSLSEFTEEEFEDIASTCRHISYDSIMITLALKLNSEGARNFLINRVEPMTLIDRIVLTSGLNNRAEYYSGRGALMCDLNGEHLISIYNKLAKIAPNIAFNMAKMTLNMPTLGATEFLESLYRLAYNKYSLKQLNISTDNVSLGNARGKDRETIAMASIASSFGGYRRDDTDAIKAQFCYLLPKEVVHEICGNNQSYGSNQFNPWNIYGYSRRRKR